MVALSNCSRIEARCGDRGSAAGHLREAGRLALLRRDRHPLDAQVLLEAVEVLKDLALWASTEGDVVESRRLFEELMVILAKVPALERNDRSVKFVRGMAILAFAQFLKLQGCISEAQGHLTGVLVETRRWSQTEPDNQAIKQRLASSLIEMGDILVLRKDLEGAKRHFTESHAIRKELSEREPTDFSLRRALRISLERLGDISLALDDLPEAERLFEECRREWQSAIDMDGSDFDALAGITVPLDRLGDITAKRGDSTAARRHYVESMTIRRRLIHKSPTNMTWQTWVRISQAKLESLE